MNSVAEKLQEIFHVSRYGARLYQAAVQFDHATLSQLAVKAGIPRTAAYPPLQELLQKGFLSVVKIKKRKYYKALDPRALRNIFERRAVDLDQAVLELLSNQHAASKSPVVTYFAGRDGIAAVADLLLGDSKVKLWKTFESGSYGPNLIEKHQMEDYIRRRVEKGIEGRMIFSAGMLSPWLQDHLSHDKEELRETIMISEKDYPFEAMIGICGNMAAFYSVKEENPFAIMIRNKEIARTLESIHDLIWSRYRS